LLTLRHKRKFTQEGLLKPKEQAPKHKRAQNDNNSSKPVQALQTMPVTFPTKTNEVA
jgi:hypothetical protein